MLTLDQIRKYRAAWKGVAVVLKDGGLDAAQVENMRRDLLVQAGRQGLLDGWTEGEEASSKALTNDGLSQQLEAFAMLTANVGELVEQQKSRQRVQCLWSIAQEIPNVPWLVTVVKRIYGITLRESTTREELAKGRGLERLADEEILKLRRRVGNAARRKA